MCNSGTTEDELVVVVPPVLLGVGDDRLAISRTAHAGAARSHHAEPGRLQSVKRLLNKRMLQVEACCFRRYLVGCERSLNVCTQSVFVGNMQHSP